MRLKHKTPCKECPWRKNSLQGYLGGHPVEYYSDAVIKGEIPACHLSDHGSDDDRTAFCAGAASVMANQCMQPYKQEGAAEAVKTIGKNPDTFGHAAIFHGYHAGEPYVHPLMRQR